MLIAAFVSIIMIIITVSIHYTILRAVSFFLTTYCRPKESMVFLAICGVFLAHLLEISAYAGAFYWLSQVTDAGNLVGAIQGDFMSYFYYSIVMYTSLGIGDVFPVDHLRIISGIETLNGLVLIGWSTSFTFLIMRSFWPLEENRRST